MEKAGEPRRLVQKHSTACDDQGYCKPANKSQQKTHRPAVNESAAPDSSGSGQRSLMELMELIERCEDG